MGKQEAEFLKGEGDAWFERNKDKPWDAASDPVIQAIIKLPSKFLSMKDLDVLEIGCGRCHRLNHLQNMVSGTCVGNDVSLMALNEASKDYPSIETFHDSAKNICGGYDLIIFGFCLYVCDPEDLQLIVHEADNSLVDGGYLVIQDFDPEHPHKVPYHHKDGLFSYKMDHSRLWLANPAYSLVSKTVIPDGTAVWVLKKNIAAGWPEEKL